MHPNKEIQAILAEIATKAEEHRHVLERTYYTITFYNMLKAFHDYGRLLHNYYNLPSDGTSIAISALHQIHQETLYSMCQSMFGIMEQSAEFYGDDYRRVEVLGLADIDAIDLTAIGVHTIVPKDLSSPTGTVVGLNDLDKIRLAELQSVSGMVAGQPEMVTEVRDIIQQNGGMIIGELFSFGS